MRSSDLAAGRRLPRGRHGLSREQVVASQRTRMLRAMAEVVTEKGFAATSVADVLRGAGVSRETFYEQFSSKEDCFMAALEAAVEAVFAVALREPGPGRDRWERFDRVLGEYLDALAAQPVLARMFLLEVVAAGPQAVARRTALQRRYAERLAEILRLDDEDDLFAAEALVMAVSGLVTARLAEDDLNGLRALHGPLSRLARRLFA